MNKAERKQDLEDQLTEIWELLQKALAREDWQQYWKLRRTWLSVGRLYSILVGELAEESRAQLTLLDDGAGRHHDRAS